MKIFIVDKNKITRYNLPLKIEDTFSISYKPENYKDDILISFEEKENQWYLRSNGSVNVFNNNYETDGVYISEYENYLIKPFYCSEFLNLFVLPSINENTYKLSFGQLDNISIGSGKNCNIIYSNNLLADIHAEFKYINNEWYIVSQENCKTFLNSRIVVKSKLNIGDVIFIYGLKIIWMGTFIKINNPRNLVTVINLNAYSELESFDIAIEPVTETDKNVSLYSDDDYFYHIPRIKEVVEEQIISIDPPPSSQKKEDMPFFLTIGSSLTMGASSLMMIYNIIMGLTGESKSIWNFLPQIVTCVAMIFASLIIPSIIRKYQKKLELKKEALRQGKYKEYLSKKEAQIQLILKQQAQIINDNNVSAEICINTIKSGGKNFWSREILDDEFLNIRLGIGSLPAKLIINAPEEHFSLEVDNLLKNVYDLKEKYKMLNNVPITISLLEKKLTAFICNTNNYKYMYSIILQLIALHSAIDLKIVLFTNDEKQYHWNFVKFLPHCWSDDKSQRFFASNIEEAKDVSNFLLEEYKKRKMSFKSSNNSEDEDKGDTVYSGKEFYKNFSSYYLIINDDYKLGKNIQIINDILKDSNNYGFSVVFLEDSIKNLPAQCNTFVEVGNNEGAVLEKNLSANSQAIFIPEFVDDIDLTAITKKVANVPIVTKSGLSVLPQMLSFLEMYGVSKIEQLNILNRWKNNNPVKSLSAPVGVHANRELFQLDLHEKFHGPHGLIAGSTGSGKSEFIITYILSMAVNYHPYEIQFVLIDYKGGGLAGAFENKETGNRIPHLVGTITNLDISEMNRTLVSIESELKRRQRQFNEVRDSLGEGTIDIYKYQRLYREGLVKEPMAHLFIISDEFAELKKSQPEFMQQLISTARIGRSLGVHLILATQKPSGVVNDQIWSNSKFKICLKVQDRSDSMEMLKRPEAASIKETGRFYLQVGYDDLFDIGQSGWAGAKYVPSDKIIHKVDDSIDFVDNGGSVIKTIKDTVKNDENNVNYGEQLTNIVKYICKLGEKEKIVAKKLWLDSIPKDIFINNIKQKYGYRALPYKIDPIIGEYDNPQEQLQGMVNLNLTNNGNTLIYGQTGSGKENLLTTIIVSSVMEHTPDEINFYILDFGSGMLKMFNNTPHVGEIVSLEDEELIVDTFNMIYDEFQIRKEKFSDYSGSYIDYCENSGQKLPLIVTIINNYEIFCENYSKLSDSITNLYRDGSKYGLIFIITAIATNAVRSRIVQNFSNKICLKIPDESEYRTILNAPRGLIPAKVFGRGLIGMNNTAYEFQTAQFVEKKVLVNTVRDYSRQMNEAYIRKAKKVPTVPKIVIPDYFNDVSNIISLEKIPIGFNIDTKKIQFYNFIEKNFTPILTHNMDDDKMSFIYTLLKMLKNIPNTNVCVIDLVNAFERNIEGISCLNSDFDNVIVNMYNYVLKSQDYNNKNFYVFLGIGQLISKLNNNSKQLLDTLFLNLDTIKNSYFIGIDTYLSYKNLQVETWYQSNIDKSYGIWLGNEIANQFAINLPSLTLEDRKLNFRYMLFSIVNGKHYVVKHVVEKEGELDEK